MKLKKHLRLFFSFLFLSIFLLTGCSPEATELAADVLTSIVEAEYEEEQSELPVLEGEAETEVPEETIAETFEETEIPEPIAPPEIVEDTLLEHSTDISEDGTYTTKDEVAAYLYTYGHLPSNFITKKEAKKLGWVSSEGNLDEVAPGMSIGGDYFGNYEGNLPEAKGRDYYECDIDFDGTYRNAKRIVYSSDGLIYYTEDHYETFELLYGEE